jgi:hypothetical protein
MESKMSDGLASLCISTPTNRILRSFKYETQSSQLTNVELEVLQNEHGLVKQRRYQIRRDPYRMSFDLNNEYRR